MDAIPQAELLDEGAGMLAQIRRQQAAFPLRQQTLAEEDGDRDSTGQKRYSGEGILEVAEAVPAGLQHRLVDKDVHGGSRKREHGPRMTAEDKRHQKL